MASASTRHRAALSQNFLRHPAAIRLVVDAAQLDGGLPVIEPGSGDGALTTPLSRLTGRLTGYELDPRLARRLARRLAAEPHVTIRQGDFLRVRPPSEPFAVVGNIPFSRSTDIVRWCLSARSLVCATLVTQLEFARQRTGDYGRWPLRTVQSWPEWRWRLAGRIRRDQFRPVPRTDAAVLRVERRATPLLPCHQLADFGEFTGVGFTGAGGSVYAALARQYGASRVRAVFREARLDRGAVCGSVTPEEWLLLYRGLRGRR